MVLRRDTEDYATIPRFDFYSTDLTFGVWINLINADNKAFILNDEGSSGRSVRIFIDNDRFRAEMYFLSGGDTFSDTRLDLE